MLYDQTQALRVGDPAYNRQVRRPTTPSIDCQPHVDDQGYLAWGGCGTSLSPAEARLAVALLDAQSRVVSRHNLALAAATDARRGLDAHMYRLRHKLSRLPGLALETVPKRGFRLLVPKD